jgi:predicted transcriptional regulator
MKRCKSDIMLDVLDICRNGASKTRIVYKANMNSKTVTPYINLLSKQGLLRIREGPRTLYETTPNGVNLIKTLRDIGPIFSQTQT